MMDLRFEAFNLIDRDPVLRSRLVTCATRLVYAGASDARASQDCFLVLAWTESRPPNSPPGTEVLRADVHVPRSARPATGSSTWFCSGWRPHWSTRSPED